MDEPGVGDAGHGGTSDCAGVTGGTVCGASDAQAAFVKDRPVRPADICATIYHCLGIDPEMPVYDRLGRPVPIAHGGQPIREVLA